MTAIDEEFKSFMNENLGAGSEPNVSATSNAYSPQSKMMGDSKVERFKAQFVAGVNHQVYGVNYMERYTPVVSLPVVEVFFQFALTTSMYVAQIDVLTAI